MSSQQFPRHGMPASSGGPPQIPSGGNLIPVNQSSSQQGGSGGGGGEMEGSRDTEHHGPPDHPSSGGGGGALAFRDDKQETVVVRPYPQVQAHGQQPPAALPQQVSVQPGTQVTVPAAQSYLPQGQPASLIESQMKPVLKSPMPSRLIAPAPAANQGHLPLPTKVPGQITVTMESNIPPAPSIPVATISGQQGHASIQHHLMPGLPGLPANIQIIRSNAPSPQIGSPTVPPQTFTSHLPRGAAAAAVMSSSKGPTVLRPAAGSGGGPGQPTVQHIIQQTIQSRSAVTTSTAVLPTAVAPISASRTQSPVISPAVTHAAEMVHGRPGLTIHPPPATISIQRPQVARDTATRITLPSHPGTQKTQPPHTMTQKSIFSTVTPVAAATVAPIVATNTVPSTTATGSVPHTQMTSNTIVTMTMPSHSSHATAVTTSTIPVAKVVPQPIAHAPRVQPDYQGERANLISISHRSSPNPVAMEARSDNRPSVPVQFQYFLPTYSSSPYPLTHTYTPITSSVSTIRSYPVTPQAPSSALPNQAGVGVATTVHLNPMQLMAVDRIGLQSAQISTQGIQPAPMGAQGIQPAPIGVQSLHAAGPITTQGIQQAPIAGQQQQAQTEGKPSGVVLADGSTFVASPIGSTFGATQPMATMVQTHSQGVGGAPTLASSPRPSILRKKPTNEGSCVRKNLIPSEPSTGRVEGGVRGAGSPRPAGVKPKAEVHMSMAPPVMATVEALPSQGGGEQQQQQAASSPAQQHLSQAIPSMLAPPGPPPPSQPSSSSVLSALPASMSVTPPAPASMANTVASPTQPAASSTAACASSSASQEVKIKQEAEPMDTSQPASSVSQLSVQTASSSAPSSAPSAPPSDLLPGASPRKKPRKQQHVISTEESEMVETNSTDEERAAGGRPVTSRAERRESPPREYVDEEGVRYVPVKPRPPVTLLRHYRNPWKAAYHHFQRYSDIRVKEEKKGSLQDMANQRGVACRAQGWKIHLCAAQLRQLSSLEHDVYSRLSSLQEGLIPKKVSQRAGADDDLHRINELIQGNMQRCKLVMDQVTEARDTMMKVLDHKEKVLKLLNKNGAVKKSSKLKRKERA